MRNRQGGKAAAYHGGVHFSFSVYDLEGQHLAYPGEDLRDAAIRRAREKAAEEHITLIGDPDVERFNTEYPQAEGWRVSWEKTEG